MIWQTLGIAATQDRDTIRRAYARRLRITNPEDDPQGFMALREAYEAALARIDWPDWGDEEETDTPAAGLEPAQHGPESGEAAEPTPPATAPPVKEPGPGDFTEPGAESPSHRLEQLEYETAHRAGAAELASRQQILLAALQSPWPSTSDALAAHFDAILAAPALDAIGVRNDVEDWLAATIANHFPASDPLVGPAIHAFGWGHDATGRATTPAANAVVHRRDVLDFVAVTRHPYRPLNLGWQALTRPPLPPVRMRLKAMMPGLVDEVATLLDAAASRLHGIEHWFDVAAVTWWDQHLARERIGPGHLALIPFAAVLVAIVGAAAGWPGWLTLVLASGSLAAPWLGVRFVKQPQRNWAEAPWARPEWQRDGWMGAMIALPLLALLLPDDPIAVAVIALAALVTLVWTTIAVPLPRGVTGWQRIGGITRATWPFGIIGLIGLGLMTPSRALSWSLVTLTLVLCWWRSHDALAAAAWRGLGRARRFGLPLVTGIAVVLLLAVGASAPAAQPAEAVYRLWLGISAAMIVMFIANRLADAGRIKLVLAIGWLAVLLAIANGLGRVPPDRPRNRIDAAASPDLGTRFDPGFTPASCPPDTRTDASPGLPIPAEICGTAADWIGPDDYPAKVARRGGEGVTGYELAIDAQGRVSECLITDSSGIGLLDDATCTLITARARFLPARDAQGYAIPGTYTSRVRWQLPG